MTTQSVFDFCYQLPTHYGKIQFCKGWGFVRVALLERDGVLYYKHIEDSLTLGTAWRVVDDLEVLMD